jgi:hypothetical protein
MIKSKQRTGKENEQLLNKFAGGEKCKPKKQKRFGLRELIVLGFWKGGKWG